MLALAVDVRRHGLRFTHSVSHAASRGTHIGLARRTGHRDRSKATCSFVSPAAVAGASRLPRCAVERAAKSASPLRLY